MIFLPHILLYLNGSKLFIDSQTDRWRYSEGLMNFIGIIFELDRPLCSNSNDSTVFFHPVRRYFLDKTPVGCQDIQ